MGAAGAGVGGELMFGKRFRQNAAQASVPAAPGRPRQRPQAEDRPDDAAARGRDAETSPGYPRSTRRTATFYRVDTALVVPKVAADTWQLRIHGMVDKPITLTYGDLVRRPMIEHDITLTCVSEAVGGDYIGNARWQGMLLATCCARRESSGRRPDRHARRPRDDHRGGHRAGHGRPGLDARGGHERPGAAAGHGYPVRVVVPGCTDTCPRPSGWWTWSSPRSARSAPTG